jgi:hypothetical protein
MSLATGVSGLSMIGAGETVGAVGSELAACMFPKTKMNNTTPAPAARKGVDFMGG